MVSYTEKEQNEIINEFLKVIDICDKKRSIRSDIETCKICKFKYGNMFLYKSLPSDIAKNICKFNYNECNKCKKLKYIVGHVDKHNLEHIDKIIEVLNEKENIEINGDKNDDIFIYVNLVKYPTYNKIFKNFQNRLYEHEKKYYDKEMHKELKTYYNNLWRNKKSSIENYYNKLRFRYVKEFDDNINKYDNSRGGLIDFIQSKFSVIKKIVNIIFDIITDCSLNTLLDKSKIITLNVKFMLSRFTDIDKDGFLSNDFQQYLNKRFPYLPKKENTNVKKKVYNDYLKDASDFD